MNHNPGPDRPFVVESLSLAAALAASGVRLDSIERTPSGRLTFRFDSGRLARARALEYMDATLCVNVRAFIREFERLRTVARGGAR